MSARSLRQLLVLVGSLAITVGLVGCFCEIPGPAGDDDDLGCIGGQVLDCDDNCSIEEYVGDGECDDGTLEYGNFDCEEFNYDGGDCD